MNPEQVVHYKIFLCAAGYEPEIRRITIDRDICHNYFYLKQKILAIFPTLKDVSFTISWKDREGDNIRICTDDELVIALKEMESLDFKKIYVNATPQGKEGPLHPNVICDGCEQAVQGFRYHCIVCPDYDLCPDCERSQIHPDHPMIRIPLPLSAEMPFGRRFARDVNKMTKHLERLFQQSADYWGDKKAKGDYSPGNRKQHKMKFCPRNEVHNFIHNLVFSQLEKMRSGSGGDSSSTTNNEPQNPEPQASTSTNGECPIFEEQKKFVNLLTSGLNSFLDPLGIDVLVEEDPVKEDNSMKQPQTQQSANGSAGGNAFVGTAAASASEGACSLTPATVISPSVVTRVEDTSTIGEPQLPPVNFCSPVAVVAPATAPAVGVTAAVPAIGIQAPLSTVGAQAPLQTVGAHPPISSAGTQPQISSVGAQPIISSVGVQPPISFVGAQPIISSVGVQPPISSVGVQPPISSVGTQPQILSIGVLPQLASAFIQGQSPLSPLLGFQGGTSAQSSQEETSVLDPSWTIVNNAMGDSMIVHHPGGSPSNTAAQSPAASPAPAHQTAQGSDRIYPELGTSGTPRPYTKLDTEEALMIMRQLGYKDEDWLRALIESKKGNLQDVLQFLSPISKPSTNLHQ